MHKVYELYQAIYLLSAKIPKKDRFGIWLKIENVCLEIINLTIAAALENKNNKIPLLNSARIKIETLKQLFRLTLNLNVIGQKQYLNLEGYLQELSKMASGWIKYLDNNLPKEA
ncbi:MAG: four helix bundle protein [Candidatus Komeilibacteria bacterium]|nr:four helix bundle protein [Candidatus Komeilibacteria bacterium]